MQSNPMTPYAPASPVYAVGTRGSTRGGGLMMVAGSTFLSSVGQEGSTDTKMKEGKDDMLDEEKADKNE